MQYKVVVTDYIFPDLDVERRELEKIGARLVECASSDEESIIREARDADAVLTCYAEVTSRVISGLEKCRVISRYGIGVNNIDVSSATKKGIAVTYVPDYCVEEVSDHALALILSCARKVCRLDAKVKKGIWDFKNERPIYRLRGLTLGLIGFGKIPRRLVEKVAAYNFKILAYDPYAEPGQASGLGVQLAEWDQLVEESDIISVHAPLTAETRGMLDYDQFKKMKKRVILVNTARGAIIKEKDLVRALKEGLLSAVALDVLETEAFDSKNPLLGFDNVVLTPHVAFYSEESMKELQQRAVESVVQVLAGKMPRVCLNPEVFEAKGQ